MAGSNFHQLWDAALVPKSAGVAKRSNFCLQLPFILMVFYYNQQGSCYHLERSARMCSWVIRAIVARKALS